ncbi:retroviral-like aspartic protease [Candidatus Roizmanbacteria bacterium]|nr:retroviral-like aspartic protease [Candidatus Roizmanbacteria bacterium]
MVIPYTLLPNKEGKPIHLPLIKVTLNYRKTHKITPVPISALIDSGADVCFCNETIGAWLGIKFNNIKEKTFTTANRTTFKAKSEMITLDVSGKSYECRFFFTDTLPQHTPIILGQLGFFDHFKIVFDYRENQIELK